MLVASLEAFPKECLGIVVTKGKNMYAFPFQLSRRYPSSVLSLSQRKFERLFAGHLRKLCDFHSHVYVGRWPGYWNLEPSGDDLLTVPNGGLEMIVGVRKVRCSAHWLRKSGKSLLAALGTYRFKISLFSKDRRAYNDVELRIAN